jgi:hypothetical protein
MEGVEGIAMSDLWETLKGYKQKTGIEVTLTYTPESLMQMYMLQILDLISGQTDRHTGNYFVTLNKMRTSDNPPKETWYINSIKGIDNDLSFGNIDYYGMAKAGRFQVPLFDQSGNVLSNLTGRAGDSLSGFEDDETVQGIPTVHYLPKSFYDMLIGYEPEMAMLDQADIRSKNELEALYDRLSNVQAQVEAMVRQGIISIIDDSDLESGNGLAAYTNALSGAFARSKGIYSNTATMPTTGSMRNESPRGVISALVRGFTFS